MYSLYTPADSSNTLAKGSPSASHRSQPSISSTTTKSGLTNDLLYTTKTIYPAAAAAAVNSSSPIILGTTSLSTPITGCPTTRHARNLSHVKINKKLFSPAIRQQPQADSTFMIPYDELSNRHIISNPATFTRTAATAATAAAINKDYSSKQAPYIPTDYALNSALPSSTSTSFSFVDINRKHSQLLSPHNKPHVHKTSQSEKVIDIEHHYESCQNSNYSSSHHNLKDTTTTDKNIKAAKRWYQHWLFSSDYWGPFTNKNHRDNSSNNNNNNNNNNRRNNKKGHWPSFTYLMITFSLIIFSGEILLSKQSTGEFFELEPFNYMLGPSIEIMIQIGARFPPCMRPVESMPADERYVCLHTIANKDIIVDDDDSYSKKKIAANFVPTDSSSSSSNSNDTLATTSPGQSLLLLDPVVDLADPRLLNSSCSLSTICGMSSFHEDNIPDQTYRLVTPLFIHTGLIHLVINMAFMLLFAIQVERVMNCLRFTILFFGSGIFGHALGGNFAPPTTPFLGCSSSLFGCIGFLYIDLMANWKHLEQPIRHLIRLLLGTAFSFILGLLPGVDNFSHLGGLISGILLSYCLMPPFFRPTHINATSCRNVAVVGNIEIDDQVGMATDIKTKNSSNNGNGLEKSSNDPLDEALELLSKPTSVHSSNNTVNNSNECRRGVSLVKRLALYCTQMLSLCLYGFLLGVLIHHFETSKIDEECPYCRYLSCLPINGFCD